MGWQWEVFGDENGRSLVNSLKTRLGNRFGLKNSEGLADMNELNLWKWPVQNQRWADTCVQKLPVHFWVEACFSEFEPFRDTGHSPDSWPSEFSSDYY